MSAPKTPNAHDEAIAENAKPIPTDKPRATGPLLVDLPEIALVITAPGIEPIAAAKIITPRVIKTSVITDSPYRMH